MNSYREILFNCSFVNTIYNLFSCTYQKAKYMRYSAQNFDVRKVSDVEKKLGRLLPVFKAVTIGYPDNGKQSTASLNFGCTLEQAEHVAVFCALEKIIIGVNPDIDLSQSGKMATHANLASYVEFTGIPSEDIDSINKSCERALQYGRLEYILSLPWRETKTSKGEDVLECSFGSTGTNENGEIFAANDLVNQYMGVNNQPKTKGDDTFIRIEKKDIAKFRELQMDMLLSQDWNDAIRSRGQQAVRRLVVQSCSEIAQHPAAILVQQTRLCQVLQSVAGITASPIKKSNNGTMDYMIEIQPESLSRWQELCGAPKDKGRY